MTSRFRILAGFGSVADEGPTIDTAMALARALEADVAGYFVEDADLLNLAALPFAKVMRPSDRSIYDVELSHMERAISRAATNWKRALNASAGRARIRCSYKTIRGTYSTEIERACASTDFVVVNPTNIPHRNPGSVSGLLKRFERAAGTVLLPEHRRPARQGPLVLIATGDANEHDLFELAERISRTTGARIEILATGTGEKHIEQVRSMAQDVFGDAADIRQAPALPAIAVAHLIADLEPSFIMMRHSALEPSMIEAVLQAGRAPLLLARGSS